MDAATLNSVPPRPLGRLARRLALGFLLLFLVPLATHGAWTWSRGWPQGWSQANWGSAGMLPLASAQPEAVVHVLGARVGRWRGIFAHHLWIVVKPRGAEAYTRYDVVGWGTPVRLNHRAADARWFGNAPEVLATLRGPEAEAALPDIERAVASYPHDAPGSYRAWPGPNSNTFVAHVAHAVPTLATALIPTAVGKDYRSDGGILGLTPSRTGVQLSLAGLAGASLGWVEGVELNILGVVAGLDLRRPALKLPGWGRIGMGVGE